MTPVDSNQFFEHGFESVPAMLILRGKRPDEGVALARRAWSAGIDLVEVPLQSEGDSHTLSHIKRFTPEGRWTGAGTITSTELVDLALDLGASFTVAPGWDPAVYRHSLANDMPHLPGVGSGTDVQGALQAGVRWQKAFPASVLRPEWFSAMRGPFPGVRFVATGGIGPGNALDFLECGASAVSLGSSFSDVKPENLTPLMEAIRDRAAAWRDSPAL